MVPSDTLKNNGVRALDKPVDDASLGVMGAIGVVAGTKSIKQKHKNELNETSDYLPGRISPTRCSATRRMILSRANSTWGDTPFFDERTVFV